jgi:uncharacterized NAD(P)/FAD-binding protein YdhS
MNAAALRPEHNRCDPARCIYAAINGTVRETVASGGNWRGVVDALRPFNQRIWQNWSLRSRQRFLWPPKRSSVTFERWHWNCASLSKRMLIAFPSRAKVMTYYLPGQGKSSSRTETYICSFVADWHSTSVSAATAA